MSTIEEQFVEFVVKSLVNHPNDVKLERTIDQLGVLLKLTVNPEDLGRVIGKRGATAQSIRTLLRALGTKNEARFNLKIVDNGEPRKDYGSRDDSRPQEDLVVSQESEADTKETEAKEIEQPKASKNEELEKAEKEEKKESFSKRTMDELDDLDDLEI